MDIMKKILDILADEFKKAFVECGYEEKYGMVSISNRPDLCEYQCNGAMAAAKQYKKAPIMIANDVVAKLESNKIIENVSAVNPGFINFNLNSAYVADYINNMSKDDKLGLEKNEEKTVVIDFGGANVAKPLHVGHLRSAVIGESIKRILKYAGHKVVGDVHLGDWGLQMGLIITELEVRKPELVYFDEKYEGEYPKEAPFTISELEEIYPCASGKSKEDEEYKKKALEATLKLQQGYPAYRALWKHIIDVSVEDLKKNYGNLNVSFDLWKGESDADEYIPEMIDILNAKELLHESQGAMVVDVMEETDTKEIPPCIVQKSDGAALYATSDLATLVQRRKDFDPDMVLYVVDKRQEMHFTQVFRVAKKADIVKEDTNLTFIGFGTMNGKDGKPFKTREGGVMRLEHLLKDVNEAVYNKIMENRSVSEEEARETSKIIGLSAVKYGDLSNQASKDYVFDIERFSSFEGNTGPYILYTIVRIKSILAKYEETGTKADDLVDGILSAGNSSEKGLMLEISKFNDVMENVVKELAPHKICSYIYDVSNAFNKFYHDTKIMSEEDKVRQASYIKLLELTKRVLETEIELLGFEAPDRM